MYIDLKKTLEEISRCLPEKGAPTPKQLQRMYELTQRLESQELAVIYDMEAFDGPAAQEQRTLAQQHSGGENRNGIVTLKIGEPLPSIEEADGGGRGALEGHAPCGDLRRGSAGTAAVF